MNLHFPLRKFSISSLTLCAALSLALLADLPAVGQTQRQQSTQQASNSQLSKQPEAKQKKIWTNDDVIALRTPADLYLLQKETQEAAAAEAAAEEAAKAKLADGAGPAETLPTTVEETRKLIAAKESQIGDDQQALDRYTAELPDEPAERKDRMQEEINRITADLPRERSQLRILQDHLEELTKKQLNEASVPPPAPPSQ